MGSGMSGGTSSGMRSVTSSYEMEHMSGRGAKRSVVVVAQSEDHELAVKDVEVGIVELEEAKEGGEAEDEPNVSLSYRVDRYLERAVDAEEPMQLAPEGAAHPRSQSAFSL